MPEVVLSPHTAISDAPGAPGGVGEAGLPAVTVPLPPEHDVSKIATPKHKPRARFNRLRFEFELILVCCMNSFELIFPSFHLH